MRRPTAQHRRSGTVDHVLYDICDEPDLRDAVDDTVRAAVERLTVNVPSSDDVLLCAAVRTAIEQHRGQYRESGECYASHPIEVAAILARWGFDSTTLAAACCHDVLEDCAIDASRLAALLGDDVVRIIDGVSKVLLVDIAAAESASLAKFVAAAAHDARVLAVKIADRLHNLRTAEHLAEHRRIRLATEALDVFSPLAHRLGLEGLRHEIEDLAFAVLYPQDAARIAAALEGVDHVALRDRVAASVAEMLADAGIDAAVEARAKHRYSVFQKIQRGTPLLEMHDLVGVRAVVETTEACYQVLGALHARYVPVPGRFKDFIALPRPSGYQSLHTTVLVDGLEVEMQVRTRAMHLQARFGAAAHYVYKHPGPRRAPDADLLEALASAATPEAFLEHLREDLAPRHEVVVLTPRGKPVTLPAGSTVIDFAYKIHTDIGHRCTGARVNGRIAPIRTVLTTGDTVEVLLGPVANPHQDWLAVTRTARARDKIRKFLAERPLDPVALGNDLLTTTLRLRGLDPATLDAAYTDRLARRNGYADHAALCAALGSKQRTPGSLLGLPVMRPQRRRATPTTPPALHAALDTALDGLPWSFPRCCAPADPGDAVAIVSKNRRFVVHDRVCASLADTVQQLPLGALSKLVAIDPSAPPGWVEVRSVDRPGLLRDLSEVFTTLGADITAARSESTQDGVLARFTLDAAPPAETVRTAMGVLDAVISVVLR